MTDTRHLNHADDQQYVSANILTPNPNDPQTYCYDRIALYYNSGSPAGANETQYTRVWLPKNRVITKMRTNVVSGANGTRQLVMGIYAQANQTNRAAQAATTIAVGSNGVALPTGTINVASITGFPTSGTVFVTTASGVQTVAYTGLGASSFTGCTGGVGTMSTGGAVSTRSRVATTGNTTVPNATTGEYDINLTSSYTTTYSGFYWLAISPDNSTMAFLLSEVFRAGTINRNEETPGAFGLQALAGTTTNPQSAVVLALAVE